MLNSYDLNPNNVTKRAATIIGFSALLLWAILPSIVTSLRNIPTFEILTTAFSICFLLTITKLTLTRQWKLINQPFEIWLIGTVGIFGNEAGYITAFKYAPAAEVTLIFYTWPILVFLLPCFLYRKKIPIPAILSCIMGLAAVYLATTNGKYIHFNSRFYIGYLYAFIAALVWGVYTFIMKHKTVPAEMIGMYCGISAVVAALIHFNFEPFVMPTLPQLNLIILMGLTTEGFAYMLWNYGVQKGNANLLYTTAYGNSAISLTILILLGQADLKYTLVISYLLIILSNMLNELDYRRVVTIAKLLFTKLKFQFR